MLKYKEDYEEVVKRFDAFWEQEIIDRPLTSITLKKEKQIPMKQKTYNTLEDKWMDFEYRAQEYINYFENSVFYADAAPVAFPNLGPEIFSATCGCEYNFGETTTWSEPCILDWEKDYDKGRLNHNSEYFKALEQYTKVLLEVGKDKFIVGLTDFHPGGDHLAALRNPQNLCIDMIENVDYVKEKLAQSYEDYFECFDYFYNITKQDNIPISTWLNALGSKKMYIPSNDFSCMISKKMFDDVFLDGIIKECDFLDQSIYHLDGPGALIHLDSILDIKKLNGLQWVCGASNEGYQKWIKIYQKIQNKKKSLMLYLKPNEIDLVFETLRPEGVWLTIYDVENKEQADYILNRIKRWK